MRRTRIFVEQALVAESEISITGQAARHVSQVLRKTTGDVLWLFDGSGCEFPATITAAAKSTIEVLQCS